MKNLAKILLAIQLVLVLPFSLFVPTANALNTNAARFVDTNSESLQAVDNADVSITGDITVEAWIKWDSINNDGTILQKYLAAAGDQRSYLWHFDNAANEILTFGYCQAGTCANETRVNTGKIGTGLDDAWHHWATVCDVSAASCTNYLDGVATTSTIVLNGSTAIFDSTSEFWLGARDDNGAGEVFFDGDMDEVRLWNDIRTSTEIADNFDCSLAGTEANLVGYWRLDEASGNRSDSAKSTTLTDVNTVGATTDLPFTATCGAAVAPDTQLQIINLLDIWNEFWTLKFS